MDPKKCEHHKRCFQTMHTTTCALEAALEMCSSCDDCPDECREVLEQLHMAFKAAARMIACCCDPVCQKK